MGGGAKGTRGVGDGRVGRSLKILSEATREGGDDVVGEGEMKGSDGEDGQGCAGDVREAGNRQVTEHLVISWALTGGDVNDECGADEGGVPGGGRGGVGGIGDEGGERVLSVSRGIRQLSALSAVAIGCVDEGGGWDEGNRPERHYRRGGWGKRGD